MAKNCKIGASCGLVLAVLVLVYGFLLTRTKMPAINDWLLVLVCPPSIALISLDRSAWPTVVLFDLLVVLMNALWYGLIFGVIERLFRRMSSVS